MLPKKDRLNLEKDFKWVASGKKVESRFAKLFIKTGDNLSPKAGVAVSGKIFKKATQRNRAKRLISTALGFLFCEAKPKNINILVLPKQSILEVKSEELLEDLKKILGREGIL